MSNALTKIPQTLAERRAALSAIAKQVDEISETGIVAFAGAGGKFAEELTAAQAMVDLRALLTDDVLTPVMAMMNTDLGFRTDRDPNASFKPQPPYPVAVVREVFIESRLRGFHTVGNEFNIIAGRFYACKNGFRRKLTDGKTFPGLSDFCDFYEVPELKGDNATVKCRATWKLNGVAASLERVFPIKVNSFMGSDAILGKAERKLCKAVHDRVAGVNTPDADIDDLPRAKDAGASEAKTAPAPNFDDHPPGLEPTGSGQQTAVSGQPEATIAKASVNYVRGIRGLLKLAKLDDSDALAFMRGAMGLDETLATLEEVALAAPVKLAAFYNQWKDIEPRIKAANGGAK